MGFHQEQEREGEKVPASRSPTYNEMVENDVPSTTAKHKVPNAKKEHTYHWTHPRPAVRMVCLVGNFSEFGMSWSCRETASRIAGIKKAERFLFGCLNKSEKCLGVASLRLRRQGARLSAECALRLIHPSLFPNNCYHQAGSRQVGTVRHSPSCLLCRM